jgi:hypothetical protein
MIKFITNLLFLCVSSIGLPCVSLKNKGIRELKRRSVLLHMRTASVPLQFFFHVSFCFHFFFNKKKQSKRRALPHRPEIRHRRPSTMLSLSLSNGLLRRPPTGSPTPLKPSSLSLETSRSDLQRRRREEAALRRQQLRRGGLRGVPPHRGEGARPAPAPTDRKSALLSLSLSPSKPADWPTDRKSESDSDAYLSRTQHKLDNPSPTTTLSLSLSLSASAPTDRISEAFEA